MKAGRACAFACAWLGAALTLRPSFAAAPLDHLMRLREGRSRRATSTRKLPDGRPDPNSNGDNFRVPPGKTHVLADLKGPGVITHIWMTFLGPEPHPWAKAGAANHKQMLLRIVWDGRERPGVASPVGDFFAAGFGRRMAVHSVPVQVENGASYNCFWPMPFAKSARVEIHNDSDKEVALLYYNVDWVQRDSLPADTPYFHAQYRQEYPVAPGKDYVIFEGAGRGHYVGTVLCVRSRSPGWFGEGDEKISVDDDASPSIWGTGTEDYFLCAWGLRKCSYPYFGVPYTDGGHVLGGKTCAYRWHVADPIVFQKRLRVAIEHYGWIAVDENPKNRATSWNEREDDYSSVAFWYQLGEPKPFATVPPAARRRLPAIDLVVHGKDFVGDEHHGAGRATVQRGRYWTGHAQMLYRPPSQDDAWVEVPFTVPRREPRRLLLKLTTSYDFGIYEATLDGVKLRRLDLYSPTIEVREFPLLDFWPKAGRHVLRLVCVGKRDASTGHWLGFDSLRLRERRPRVARYGWDKDKDWRKARILY